ncbi:hypothetical protein SCUCBS95973_009596 [Sporothrix curviconia]|uniref:Uncharacterized protein n=1 Tax=Sporothrix curviconia TaxID=1260050 RepID=A0ABP0CX76_9PEZI
MTGTTNKPGQPARRKFAPVPIETTFERYRKGAPQVISVVPIAPTAELTPSPSPQSASPPPPTLWTLDPSRLPLRPKEEKRRFAPQLIESSRRSRRAGDIGPATRPTDKTDITPYHNHIYAPKFRKKHRKTQSLARRESCDEETAGHVFEMLAREAEKRMLEDAALAAYPNSRARAGGAEHFVIREGSDDDSSDSRSRDMTDQRVRTTRHSRRDSQSEDVGWALREMQEHHEQLSKVRAASVASSSPYIASGTSKEKASAAATATGTPDMAAVSLPQPYQLDRIATIDLDRMSIESPPNDPIWTTTARQATQDSAIQPIGESFMPYIPEESIDLPGIGDGFRGIPSYAQKLREAEGDVDDEDEDDLLRQSAATSAPRAIGEAPMPYIAPAASSFSSTSPDAKATTTTTVAEVAFASDAAKQIPTDTAFRGRNAYAGYRNRDLFASERDVHKLRKKSPPMLGKELVFPKCASPKQTKLEPEFLWTINDCMEKSHQDASGQHGLWHGLCFSNDKNQAMVPLERPALLETPLPPRTPGDPFAHAFSLSVPGTVYSEPSHVNGTASATTAAAAAAAAAGHAHGGHGLPHKNAAEPKGLHMLAGLDERLRQEKAAAELEENIAAEFTDRFVTQVYNYLSLGYPSMAWSYDDELSKISRIPVDDLEQDDASNRGGGGGDSSSSSSLGPGSFSAGSGSYGPDAKGHISLDEDDKNAGQNGETGENGASYNHDSCPRWRALKIYIFEWARQHPDLNAISPLAWGMRERRGSWGV